MFLVLVRPSRYTYLCIGRAGDFTVNVFAGRALGRRRLLRHALGRTVDKMGTCDLTPLPSQRITSAGIAEANAVFECRVVHHNDVQEPAFRENIVTNYYPDGDFHRVYYGEVLHVSAAASLIEAG